MFLSQSEQEEDQEQLPLSETNIPVKFEWCSCPLEELDFYSVAGFSFSGLIGSSNAPVYKFTKESEVIAVKELKIRDSEDYFNTLSSFRTLQAIKSVSHPNIVQILGFCKALRRRTYGYEVSAFLAMEYCDGNLDDFIQMRKVQNNIFTDSEIKQFFFEMLSALSYLQQHLSISHRDIKPQNILVQQGHFKIADFDDSKISYNKTIEKSIAIGTVSFMAPEILKAYLRMKDRLSYNSYRSDVYSLGLCLLYMCTFEKFSRIERIEGAKNKPKYGEKIKQLRKKVKQIYGVTVSKLIKIMLDPDPWKRPDFDNLKGIAIHKGCFEAQDFFGWKNDDINNNISEQDKQIVKVDFQGKNSEQVQKLLKEDNSPMREIDSRTQSQMSQESYATSSPIHLHRATTFTASKILRAGSPDGTADIWTEGQKQQISRAATTQQNRMDLLLDKCYLIEKQECDVSLPIRSKSSPNYRSRIDPSANEKCKHSNNNQSKQTNHHSINVNTKNKKTIRDQRILENAKVRQRKDTTKSNTYTSGWSLDIDNQKDQFSNNTSKSFRNFKANLNKNLKQNKNDELSSVSTVNFFETFTENQSSSLMSPFKIKRQFENPAILKTLSRQKTTLISLVILMMLVLVALIFLYILQTSPDQPSDSNTSSSPSTPSTSDPADSLNNSPSQIQQKCLKTGLVYLNGSCVTKCPVSKYYLDIDTSLCVECHSSCSECTGGLANQCKKCITGLFLLGLGASTGLCVADCPDNFLKDSSTSRCLKCPGYCSSCSYQAIQEEQYSDSVFYTSNEIICQGCEPNYYLLGLNICTTSCPRDTLPDNSSFKCLTTTQDKTI